MKFADDVYGLAIDNNILGVRYKAMELQLCSLR